MFEPRYSRTFQTVLLFLIVALLCSLAYSKIIYVDDDAAGANDGSSWENAYVYLQDALADATIRMITQTNPVRAFGFKSDK